MKSVKQASVWMLAGLLMFASCKKDKEENKTPTPKPYTCSNCISKPEALAVNDSKGKGIYKGVIIGSSGTIKFSIANDGTTISAVMVIDGKTVNLTSSVAWVDGQPYIAPFTGTLDGSPVSITFSVQFDGSVPQIISSDIPGHPGAVFTLIKETSAALIECFEGTYSTTKPESGTFNIVLSRSLGKYGGVARKTGGTTASDIDGTISGGIIKDEKGNTMGKLDGDELSGEFKDSNGATVNFSGKRTL